MFDQQAGVRTTASTAIDPTGGATPPATSSEPQPPTPANRVAEQAAAAASAAERDRDRTMNTPDWSEQLRDGLIGAAGTIGAAQQGGSTAGATPPPGQGTGGSADRGGWTADQSTAARAPSTAATTAGPRCNILPMTIPCSANGRAHYFLYRSVAATLTSFLVISAREPASSGISVDQCVAQGVPPGSLYFGKFPSQARANAEAERECPPARRVTGFRQP
jgi:hypothetical protein